MVTLWALQPGHRIANDRRRRVPRLRAEVAGGFRPVRLDRTDGKTHEEPLLVDGGISEQIRAQLVEEPHRRRRPTRASLTDYGLASTAPSHSIPYGWTSGRYQEAGTGSPRC